MHRLRRLLDRGSNIRWLWAVHCETSTGVLNDIEALKAICAERDIRLCMDCISSIGTVPIDLDGVYLASGVSGKGIGAFPGLSLVFYHHKVLPAPSALPGCLDLGLYRERDGVPFTISSNLLYALRSAVKRLHQKRPFDDLAALSIRLRSGLLEVGFRIVAPEAHASPAVVTIPLPESISSEEVGRRLEERGYLLHYKSGYLVERNWIQICPMGKFPKEALCSLLKSLREAANPENFRDVTQPWRPPENFLADFVSDYSRINPPELSADRGKDPIQ